MVAGNGKASTATSSIRMLTTIYYPLIPIALLTLPTYSLVIRSRTYIVPLVPVTNNPETHIAGYNGYQSKLKVQDNIQRI